MRLTSLGEEKELVSPFSPSFFPAPCVLAKLDGL